MGFIRRATTLPSAAVLLAVSGVFIVDAAPQQPLRASRFGKICLVGEFEDGPFNTPTDLLQPSDQAKLFGGFGFQYGSVKGIYPCALSSGGSEQWNGNGWVQSAGLTFNGLCFCRVDTSIGTATLSPLAYTQSTLKAPYVLANADTTIFSVDGAGDTTVTWAATAAIKSGSGGVFSGVVGGETFQLSYDLHSFVEITLQPGDTTVTAINARINTAFGFTFASNNAGQIRLTSPTKGTGSFVQVTGSAFTDTLGLTSGGSDSVTNGTGDASNIALTTAAEFKAKLEAASGSIKVTTSVQGYQRIVSITPVTGTIQVKSHTAADGFATQATASTTAVANEVIVPSGTRLTDGSDFDTVVVTMVSVTYPKASGAAQTIKVRPGVDDGTYAGLAADRLDTVEDRPSDLEWFVTNGSSLSVALTSIQLDSLYLAAITATLGPGDAIRKKINGIVSARQSNAIRSALVNNETTASASGHFSRRAFICSANGSTATQIIASTAPGVGAYREEGATYCAGGVKCLLQPMIDAGYGDADSAIVRHPDVFLASRWSTLNPGYNPGQLPEDPVLQWGAGFVTGVETEAQNWDIDTYIAFKQAGVCAVQYDNDLGLTFEEGITTVDPTSDPSRTTISRHTLAGYIGDTLSSFSIKDAKRQGTEKRIERTKIAAEGFLQSLVGDTVAAFLFTPVDSGITNVRRYNVLVEPIQSDDVIVFALTVGAGAITVGGLSDGF